MSVYQSILGVMEDLSKVGVGKDRRNEQQNFAYRGIDDVRDTVAPFLVKNKLLILPQVLSREMVERQSRNGGALFCVLIKLQYEFLCVEDGSTKLVGPFYSEAMDTSDKATNKAMSAAYKYMCIDTFCIRTKGDEAVQDADATVHDVVPSVEPAPIIQQIWDGTKKVGFTKQFRTSQWLEVSQEFLDWCNVDGHDKLNPFQQECALLEQQRRDRLIAELPKDMPESFFVPPDDATVTPT